MTNAISLLRSKFFMLSCGIFTALSSVSVFAQDETGGLDDTILNNVNFDSIISDISAKMTPSVSANAAPDIALTERQRMIARAAGMSFREYYALVSDIPKKRNK